MSLFDIDTECPFWTDILFLFSFIEESGTNELNQPYYWFRLTEDNHGGIMAKFTENEIIREM